MSPTPPLLPLCAERILQMPPDSPITICWLGCRATSPMGGGLGEPLTCVLCPLHLFSHTLECCRLPMLWCCLNVRSSLAQVHLRSSPQLA